MSTTSTGTPNSSNTQTEPQEPSDASRALSEYYLSVQNGLLAQGLLRTDGGGPDAPYSSRDLVNNFIEIALFEEYATASGRTIAQKTPSTVHRWEKPVRMKIEFGQTVPLPQQQLDRTRITTYASRLSRLTGQSIKQTTGDANFYVFVANKDEREALGPQIEQIIPGINKASVSAIVNMDRSTYCVVVTTPFENSAEYARAIAVIPGEHPDLLRQSCIHEELAQGMGLPNDSPSARPSIFNDDEEFALLTTHDEMLLRILYDPRIRPGMNAEQAREQAEVIVAEMLGSDS
ncbi:MAG: DUF2927 domain-containing protein [Marinosulfonomonas sp.]